MGTAMRENISPAGAPPRAAPGTHPTSGISYAGVSAALKTPTRADSGAGRALAVPVMLPDAPACGTATIARLQRATEAGVADEARVAQEASAPAARLIAAFILASPSSFLRRRPRPDGARRCGRRLRVAGS